MPVTPEDVARAFAENTPDRGAVSLAAVEAIETRFGISILDPLRLMLSDRVSLYAGELTGDDRQSLIVLATVVTDVFLCGIQLGMALVDAETKANRPDWFPPDEEILGAPVDDSE